MYENWRVGRCIMRDLCSSGSGGDKKVAHHRHHLTRLPSPSLFPLSHHESGRRWLRMTHHRLKVAYIFCRKQGLATPNFMTDYIIHTYLPRITRGLAISLSELFMRFYPGNNVIYECLCMQTHQVNACYNWYRKSSAATETI